MPAAFCWAAITARSTLFHELHDYLLLGVAVLFAAIASYQAIRQMRRTAERAAQMQFRQLAESIPSMVWTASPGLGVDYCNRRWSDLTGMTMEQSLGFGWMEALHPDDRERAAANWKKGRDTGMPMDAEYRFRTAAGVYRWYLARANPMRDDAGNLVKWFGSCGDIHDQRHTQEVLEEQVRQRTAALFDANARLQQESIRDPLTGLYNRRYLDDTLERETRRSVRAEGKMGVLMLDLDHFKKINDTCGHEAGDQVLREVSRFLTKSVRAEDVVCRYGGEEFVVILPMADLATSHARAERIRTKVRELAMASHGRPVGTVTVSVGVAALPDHGTTPSELIESADTALYRAKREGRDRVVVAQLPGERAEHFVVASGSGLGSAN